LVGLLGGFSFPKFWFFPGYNLRPILQKVSIPPMLAMVLMGFISRNFSGGALTDAYPSNIAIWFRNCVVAVLLTRGGMGISFTGHGFIMVLVIITPQFLEATMIALVGKSLFHMPMSVSYCLGYCVATVAGSLVVPGMLNFLEKGYGKAHGIPSTMIACCTFENIDAIIFFGICNAIAMS